MIKRLLFSLFSMVMASVALAERPAGFLWYNLPKDEKKAHPQGVPFNKLSYTARDAVLQFYTMEALHKVRFTHKLEDERVFLALQDYWLREATLHGKLNQRALLAYPQYDYSVTHPTSALGTKLYDSLQHEKQRMTLEMLAKQDGLLFFYRAKNPMDRQQIPILQDFCNTYHFSLIPISVDGVRSPELPNSRLDRGQAERLGVRYFPALLLVNPKSHITAPVAYGLITQDVLAAHIMAVANQFQGDEV